MKKLTLDFKKFMTPGEAHEYIAKKLGFPEYYGKNLDALYDCLTDITDDVRIEIKNYDALDFRENAMVEVFLDAAAENSSLDVELKRKKNETGGKDSD